MDLTKEEKAQLAAIMGCVPDEVDTKTTLFVRAATEEYLRMILGQRVFTRGQDIREYRLYLMIVHAFGGQLPSERTISALFQTTATQSRALLRAVMSKYQYELQQPIRDTLRAAITNASGEANGTRLLTIDSENVIEALNREIASIDGTLPQIVKARNTVSTYEIPPSSYDKLRNRLK